MVRSGQRGYLILEKQGSDPEQRHVAERSLPIPSNQYSHVSGAIKLLT